MYSSDDKTMTDDETLSLSELADMDGAKVPEFAEGEFEKKAADLPGPDASKDGADEIKTERKSEVKGGDSPAATSDGGKEKPATEATEEEKSKVFPSAAQVFGISEDQLQTEFNRFKADKLFKKVFIELTDPQLKKEAFLSKLAEAVAYNLGGVTVLPDALPTALKDKPAIDVYVAVCYPYGAESFEVKKVLVKKALATSVSGVVLYFGQFEYRLKKRRQLVREYKKLLGYGKRKKVIVAVNVESLTPAEMQDISSLLFEAGAKEVRAVVSDIRKEDIALDKFVKSADGKFDITVTTGKTDDKCMVTALNLGASAVACENAVEVAKCFKDMLNL